MQVSSWSCNRAGLTLHSCTQSLEFKGECTHKKFISIGGGQEISVGLFHLFSAWDVFPSALCIGKAKPTFLQNTACIGLNVDFGGKTTENETCYSQS